MPRMQPLDFSRKVLDLARHHGVLRPKDLAPHGIARTFLQRLVRSGAIERVGRGLYVVSGADLGEKQTLAKASRLLPNGVICLLSALQFHGFTTQTARQVWMAIPPKAWRPRNPTVPLQIVYMTPSAHRVGVQTHKVRGVTLRVFSPAKTVVDCFKFRNRIGLDVALEALREGWRARLFTMDELERVARACRMNVVMRPYLEMLVA